MQLPSGYDKAAYECATKFNSGSVEGHTGLVVTTDCENDVEVSIIALGAYDSVDFLTNGGSCTAYSTFLSCSVTLNSTKKFGFLTKSPFDILS